MNTQLQACIFDMDGVLVDTAKFHYLAWKRLAEELGIQGFSEAQNERLKGVSRMVSLEIILEIGGLHLEEEKKLELANRKNNWYRDYLRTLTFDDVLPGVLPLLNELKAAGIKIGLGSASSNTGLIIERVGIGHYLEAIMDGNKTKKAKPDPEVFLRCAEELGVAPANCIVFEDAQAGVEAAKRGGMTAIGIGDAAVLAAADWVVGSLDGVRLEDVEKVFCLRHIKPIDFIPK